MGCETSTPLHGEPKSVDNVGNGDVYEERGANRRAGYQGVLSGVLLLFSEKPTGGR